MLLGGDPRSIACLEQSEALAFTSLGLPAHTMSILETLAVFIMNIHHCNSICDKNKEIKELKPKGVHSQSYKWQAIHTLRAATYYALQLNLTSVRLWQCILV